MKKVLPNLTSSKQTAYVTQRCINKSGRKLISDLFGVTKKMKVKGYLLTIDLEKAFDLLEHTFLISTLEKFEFGKTVKDLIKIFLNEQESCVINERITRKYFKLEKGGRQGKSVSGYLFILYLKNNKQFITNIFKAIKMFETTFLYTAYADDSTFKS